MSQFNKPTFTKAYQFTVIDDQNSSQTRNKAKMLHNQNANHQQINNNMLIKATTLYTQQVDHNIEQIGIMAVREVKYVSQKQWLKMVKRRQKQYELAKNIKAKGYKYQSKHQQAVKRQRNSRGQFKSKKNAQKQKKIYKNIQKNSQKHKQKKQNQQKQSENSQLQVQQKQFINGRESDQLEDFIFE